VPVLLREYERSEYSRAECIPEQGVFEMRAERVYDDRRDTSDSGRREWMRDGTMGRIRSAHPHSNRR
jgi:hypothetical protein